MMIPLRDTMADGESVLSFFRRCQHDCVGGGLAQGSLNSGPFKITLVRQRLLDFNRLRTCKPAAPQ